MAMSRAWHRVPSAVWTCMQRFQAPRVRQVHHTQRAGTNVWMTCVTNDYLFAILGAPNGDVTAYSLTTGVSVSHWTTPIAWTVGGMAAFDTAEGARVVLMLTGIHFLEYDVRGTLIRAVRSEKYWKHLAVAPDHWVVYDHHDPESPGLRVLIPHTTHVCASIPMACVMDVCVGTCYGCDVMAVINDYDSSGWNATRWVQLFVRGATGSFLTQWRRALNQHAVHIGVWRHHIVVLCQIRRPGQQLLLVLRAADGALVHWMPCDAHEMQVTPDQRLVLLDEAGNHLTFYDQ